MEITDRNEWRVSKSGFSIRTGWSDEKRIIAMSPCNPKDFDSAEYQQWLDNAQHICDLHNASLNRGALTTE